MFMIFSVCRCRLGDLLLYYLTDPVTWNLLGASFHLLSRTQVVVELFVFLVSLSQTILLFIKLLAINFLAVLPFDVVRC